MDLVAPIIPDAQQNEGPKLFLSALGSGLAAAAKFAEVKRQSEDEVLKLASQERIAQDQHAFEREKLNKDTEVQDAMTKAHTQYYKDAGDALKTKAEAYSRGFSGMVEQDKQKNDYLQEFQDRAQKLQLNDPKLETSDPAQYYLNYKDLASEYGTSTLAGIPQALRNFKMRAEQHKIPLPEVSYDDNGNQVVSKRMAPKVVVGQIVEDLHNPDTHDLTYDRLKAGGYIEPGKDLSSWWQKKYMSPDQPGPEASKLLDLSSKGDFNRTPTRAQPPLNQKTRDFRGGEPAPPTDSSPPDPMGLMTDPQASAPTEVDTYLAHAKAAIAAGAPMADVAKRLQDMSIDPAQLWQS